MTMQRKEVAADLYTKNFGLRARPFTLLPDPDLFFWSRQHRQAFSVLEYGITTGAPITVLTGEVGTGKTTLVQALLRAIDDKTEVGLLSNAQGGRGDLLRWVLYALDVDAPASSDYVTLFRVFQEHVIKVYASGRRVLLIVDEAQNLGVELLEELRMLNNIDTGEDTVLQLILVGQPELRALITQPDLRQFAQRVSAFYHLQPMDLATTQEYIRYRLVSVGGTGQEISTAAMGMIHRDAGGIPRLVNKICDLAMVYASANDEKIVATGTINELRSDGIVLPWQEPALFLTSRSDAKT